MRKYTVTMDEEGLFKFLENNGLKVQVADEESLDDILSGKGGNSAALGTSIPIRPNSEPRKPRKLRGSKVNDTIFSALEGNDGATSAQIKEAMLAKGLAAGSASQALALLKKAGKIVRSDDGMYRLAA